MKKFNVICYIDSSGANVIYENFEDTVVSIFKKLILYGCFNFS